MAKQKRDDWKDKYGVTYGAEDILHICEENEMPLIPFFPLLLAPLR